MLVVPEMYGSAYARLPAPLRKVVFNQGPYYTFHDLADDDRPGAPYRDLENLALVMTVSDDGRDLIRTAFPELPIEVARPVVDAAVFHPGAAPTEHRIAFTTSRRPVERKFIVNALRARGVKAPFQVLAGLSEQGVAEALRSATVFLSFSELDGFGLPPAEAMACGCYVIGYDGGGGREFVDPAYSRPVDSTVRFLEAVLEALEQTPEQLRPFGLAASRTVLERYSADGLRHDPTSIFGGVLDLPAIA